MTPVKRNNGGLSTFRSIWPGFFNEDLVMDRLWKDESIPAVNISETDKSYEIDVAAPGLRKEDFKIEVDKGMLTISAERKEEKEKKEKNYTRREYSYSSFSRSFTLPTDAREENINAKYDNGVLKLTLAKQAEATPKAKKIAVQ